MIYHFNLDTFFLNINATRLVCAVPSICMYTSRGCPSSVTPSLSTDAQTYVCMYKRVSAADSARHVCSNTRSRPTKKFRHSLQVSSVFTSCLSRHYNFKLSVTWNTSSEKKKNRAYSRRPPFEVRSPAAVDDVVVFSFRTCRLVTPIRFRNFCF